jgi:alkanesulfonate monooxygenase SsuD/methylene tetrahydromethanopterin reductase-like flavin-dependent oxidoreductase (luciferase family)
MRLAFSIDPDQGLSEQDELQLVRLGANLGYVAAWTPSRDDTAAFDRCLRWNAASGLDVGISAVPASGQAPEFYAAHARRAWEGTGGHFTLVAGSGRLAHPAADMRRYLADLRRLLPSGQPLFVAALGPLMLRVGGELADGVALNWCTPEQVAWSRERVQEAAASAGRATPAVVEYIRTAVDPDPLVARERIGAAVRPYALGQGGYRRHFERMGYTDELRRVEAQATRREPEWDPAFLSHVGAWGEPGTVRAQVERLAAGLDLAIIRVLVRRRGDAGSARAVLEECAPGR